jgi:hypothetical protein
MPTGVYDRKTCARKSWTPSEETRRKIRAAHLGKKQSPETVKRRADSIRGVKKTLEDRAAISERMKGNKHGLGHRHSETTKAVFRQKARRGPHSNFWKGGKTEEAKLLKSSAEYREWREAVFRRDWYTCQMCGEYGGKLHADHIKRFSDFPELRLDVNNGRTLCEACHRTTPNYGRKKSAEQAPETNLVSER